MAYANSYGYTQADPMQVVLAPARRASVACFVVGPLVLLSGTCFGGLGLMFRSPTILASAEVKKALADANITSDTLEFVTLGMMGSGVAYLVLGLALAGLGVGVRRGSSGPTIAATIVAGVAGVLSLAFAIGNCLNVLLTLALGLAAGFLVHALSRTRQVKQWREYIAYQQRAAYGGPAMTGSGYSVPPPPPMSSTPTPPSSTPTPPPGA